jgi:hypothetical protein
MRDQAQRGWDNRTEDGLKLWVAYQYELARRAAQDPAFRKRLLDDPVAALRESGVDVPPSAKVDVLESSASHVYITLPPPADVVTFKGLSLADGDLKSGKTKIEMPWDDFDMGAGDAKIGNQDSSDPKQRDSDRGRDPHTKDHQR